MGNLKEIISSIGEKNVPVAALTIVFIFTGYLSDKRESRLSNEMAEFRGVTMELVRRANEGLALNNELMRRVITVLDGECPNKDAALMLNGDRG